MQVYQNYIIKYDCPNDYFMQAIDLRLHSAEGWVHRVDLEENYLNNMPLDNTEILCIETPKIHFEDADIKGIIWIWRYDDRYEVFNITPMLSNHLSQSQYNYILSVFDGEIVKKVEHDFEISIELSKPYFDMEDQIGPEAYEALEFFSQTSNRSTGNSHPLDFKKWCHFVFIVFRQKRSLSADELMNWLIEDGWDEETADELSIDFETAINMLEEYENY